MTVLALYSMYTVVIVDMEGLISNVVDESELQELVGSSVLTIPKADPTTGSTTNLHLIPNGFGEDLSAEALIRGSLAQNATHAVSSQNIISFAELIRYELQEKQRLIDKLLDESNEKTSVCP
jgi:hypothetical protein